MFQSASILKRAVMIGVAVAVIAIAAAYISFSDSQGIGMSGLITDLAMPYEKRSTDAYELELPTGWQLQPRDISDVEFDAITTGATGDQMRDNLYYTYAEPKSLEEDFSPTGIHIHTASSSLTYGEYEGAIRAIMQVSGSYYGVDYRILDIRQDVLGGKPALTIEYVVVVPLNPDWPALKAIETMTVNNGVFYSISYSGETDNYDGSLHHFHHVVESFKFK